MAQKVSDFKRGEGFEWRDGLWIFLNMDHVKPGKGPAYIQADIRNARTGQVLSNRFRPEEQLEPIFFDRRKVEYLYSEPTKHIFMNGETYEQVEVPADVIGDDSVYLTPNCECTICYVGNEILNIELPNTVELTIVDVPPNVKSATATNVQKDAKCEGGAVIKVPPFVENGEVIKVDTRTGDYLGRA
jgi:elongation factor P